MGGVISVGIFEFFKTSTIIYKGIHASFSKRILYEIYGGVAIGIHERKPCGISEGVFSRLKTFEWFTNGIPEEISVLISRGMIEGIFGIL